MTGRTPPRGPPAAAGRCVLALAALRGSAAGALMCGPGLWRGPPVRCRTGSLPAFRASTGLIRHPTPTRVGTYANVNPLIAVIMDSALGGEAPNGGRRAPCPGGTLHGSA